MDKNKWLIIGGMIFFAFLFAKNLVGIGTHHVFIGSDFDFEKGYWRQGEETFFGIYKSSSGVGIGLLGYEIKKEWWVLQENIEILSSKCEVVLNEADPIYSKNKNESKYTVYCLLKKGYGVARCCRDKDLQKYGYKLPTKDNPRIPAEFIK